MACLRSCGKLTKIYIMEKDLNYWKKNAEEDYIKTPISVVRYITELEKLVLPQADVLGRSEQLPHPKCDESCYYYCTKGGSQLTECVK